MSVIRPFDPWSCELCTCPRKYTFNPYTGCSHGCLYCYSTSYIRRYESTPKTDLIRRVLLDLKKIDREIPINMSTSTDPYPPIEERLGITRRALEILVRAGCKVLITTKSDIVLRDLDLVRAGRAAVSITITTLDDSVSRKIEPNAPDPRRRLRAIEMLVKSGVNVSVRIDPVIPLVNDDEDELRELVDRIYELGVRHVVTSTYKARPDSLRRMTSAFPELERRLRRLYYEEGERIRGYRYLRRDLRETLLRPVVQEARRLGMEYATCREGLTGPEWLRANTCDGTHLIPSRGRPELAST